MSPIKSREQLMTHTERIREFIGHNLAIFEDEALFKDDDNIFELGFVDSLFALELVSFVEKEFGIEVNDEDLNLSNFSSVSAIDALLRRKAK